MAKWEVQRRQNRKYKDDKMGSKKATKWEVQKTTCPVPSLILLGLELDPTWRELRPAGQQEDWAQQETARPHWSGFSSLIIFCLLTISIPLCECISVLMVVCHWSDTLGVTWDTCIWLGNKDKSWGQWALGKPHIFNLHPGLSWVYAPESVLKL